MKVYSSFIVALTLGAGSMWADEPAHPPLEPVAPLAQSAAQVAAAAELGPVPDYRSAGCLGCPERHWFRAIWETVAINVAINLFDRALNPEPDQFKTNPETWWANLKHGFVFDDNQFGTNQFAHPYHGSTYFNAGRSNGLGYWESAPLAAMGSFIWECCGETHPPSFNDFISTTMGGMAVGEVLHRLSLLVRDNTATRGRTLKEVTGLLINPIGGLNRLTNGDWFEVRENPPDRRPAYLGGRLNAGAIMRGEGGSLEETTTSAYLEVELIYGDPFSTRAQKPFDHFVMKARFGGGAGVSQFNLRGRLFGGGLGSDGASRTRLEMDQGFTYITNPAYEFGGQSVDGVLRWRRELSSTLDIVAGASVSFMPLGSISAEYVEVNERTYDMGVGAGTGLRAVLLRRGHPILAAGYTLYFIHTVNGSGGEHVAQFFNVEADLPLTSRIGVGAAATVYLRNSYYDPLPDTSNRHPELRAFLSWTIE